MERVRRAHPRRLALVALTAVMLLVASLPMSAAAQQAVATVGFQSATVSGATLVVAFTGPIGCPANYCVGVVLSDAITHSAIGFAGTQLDSANGLLHIPLSQAVAAGETVLVSYTPGSLTDDTGTASLTAFTDQPVTNTTIASTVGFQSATVSGATLVVAFTGPIGCPANYCVGVVLSDAITHSAIGFAGTQLDSANGLLHIPLSQAVAAGETVLVSYSPGNLTNDVGTSTVAPFLNQPVTNSTLDDTTPPVTIGDGPDIGQTPELDSLLLFGTGLTGLGGYALMRLRARRRR